MFIDSVGGEAAVARSERERDPIRHGKLGGLLGSCLIALLPVLGACGGGVSGTGDSPLGEQNDDLQVEPPTGFSTTGQAGGAVAPASMAYLLTNATSQPLSWSASADRPWVLLSSSSGTLPAIGQTTLTVSVDPAMTAALSTGTYAATVTVRNLTGGESTSRSVTLTIQADELSASPASGFVSTGSAGGVMVPPSQDYELANVSSASLSWTASADQPWIGFSEASGTLAAGSTKSVTVSIVSSATSGLGTGTYSGTVTFSDQTNSTEITRPVTLTIQSSSPTGNMSVISQFGVTWTFDTAYPAGQFVNGDWWVVGPIIITKIDPPSTVSGGRTMNGTMINPSPKQGWTQGYDSSMYAQYKGTGSYNPELNVGLDMPLPVTAGKSVVSSISIPQPDQRPQLKGVSVLTVLASPPPAGSFRPPYAGPDKTIRYNVSQIDLSLLQQLAPTPSAPSLQEAESWFERPWLDHVPDWLGRYTHPADNMPDYGREMTDLVSNAALLLHCNYTDSQKQVLLYRYLQLGIDLYGILRDGGQNNWPAGGGHHSGRKWPILFAGLMLGDSGMTGIGFEQIAFNEDDQTFYVEETSPGVYNYGQGGYQAQHVGLPEWGSQHWKQLGRGQLPTMDTVDWYEEPYRLCCTANVWWGELLAARIMGAKALWNDDALFDYQDRFRSENAARGINNWQNAWTDFSYDMYVKYRDDF